MKVKTGPFLERHFASCIAAKRCVHPIQPIADPSSARFQQYKFEARKFLERAVLHETGQGLADGIAGGHIDPESMAMHIFEGVTPGKGPRRFPCGMDPERNIEFLRLRKQHVMIWMGVRLAGHRELRHPSAFVSGLDSALQFVGRSLWIAE